MLSQEQLIAFLENTLSPAERAEVEDLLSNDPAGRRELVAQRGIDQALRVILSDVAAHERVKQSVLTVVRARSPQQFKAEVLRETRRDHRTYSKPEKLFSTRARRSHKDWLKPDLWRIWAAALRQPRLALGALTAGLVLVVIGAFLDVQLGSAPQIQAGRFVALTGTPRIQHNGKPSVPEVRLGSLIYLGDRIETGDAEKAEIQFNDGTTLTLHFDTTIDIPHKAHYQSSMSLVRSQEVRLMLGQVWCKVQKHTNHNQFALQSPVATALVHGTEFGLKVQHRPLGAPFRSAGRVADPAGLEAVLSVKEGSVQFSNLYGTVEATDMTESVARVDAAPTQPTRVGMLKTFRFWPVGGMHFAQLSSISRLSMPEAADRLVFPLGWVGLDLRDLLLRQPADPGGQARTRNSTIICRVEHDSPAERAGLRVGDIIDTCAGQVDPGAHFVQTTIFTHLGEPVLFSINRGKVQRIVSLIPAHSPNLLQGTVGPTATASRLQVATQLLLEGQGEKAEGTLKALLVTSVAMAAYNNLGVLHQMKDEMGEAIRCYQLAIQSEPASALYHLNLGLALKDIGNLDRAAEELQTAARLAPQVAKRRRLPEVFTLLDHAEDGLEIAERALKLEPRSPDLWANKAWVLIKLHRLPEARQAARMAVELEPAFKEGHMAWGYAAFLMGQSDEAKERYRNAIQIDPGDYTDFNMLAHVYLQRGEYEEAEKLFQKAIELKPDYAIAFINLGDLYTELRRFEQAAKMFQQGIALQPEAASFYAEFGNLYGEWGQFDTAEIMLLKAIVLDPKDTYLYQQFAKVCLKYNRFEQAENLLGRALALDPASSSTGQLFGALREAQGKLGEAEKICRRLVAAQPDDPRTLNWLARYLLRNKGDLDEALALAQRAAQTEPQNPEFLETLGWTYGRRGEVGIAEETLAAAIAAFGQNPQVAEAWTHLGGVYEREGKNERALEAYRTAASFQPDNRETRAALDRLNQ